MTFPAPTLPRWRQRRGLGFLSNASRWSCVSLRRSIRLGRGNPVESAMKLTSRSVMVTRGFARKHLRRNASWISRGQRNVTDCSSCMKTKGTTVNITCNFTGVLPYGQLYNRTGNFNTERMTDVNAQPEQAPSPAPAADLQPETT